MLDAASAADINIDLGDAEKVTIWPKDKALDIPAVHISPDHGLIGYPVYTMTGLSATTTFCLIFSLVGGSIWNRHYLT